jgi:tRNA A37 N6-isopentenylltransferase MiaA
VRLQARPPRRIKSPSLDENDQLRLTPAEQAESDEMRRKLAPDDAREFLRIWWQARRRAARRTFNDPQQVDRIVEILQAAGGPQ